MSPCEVFKQIFKPFLLVQAEVRHVIFFFSSAMEGIVLEL